MEITETRKKIIDIINPFMDKTLSKGCLIYISGCEYMFEYILKKDGNYALLTEDGDYTIVPKPFGTSIIGHYDISAILKYITDNVTQPNIQTKTPERYDCSIYLGDEGQLIGSSICGDFEIGEIFNKPLHLYTEEEDKKLLDILLKGEGMN